MFCLLYAEREYFKKEAFNIENRYLSMMQFKTGMQFEDTPILDRTWLVMSTRTKDILDFLRRFKVVKAYKVVNVYEQSKRKGTPLAVKDLFNLRIFPSAIPDVLEAALSRQFPQSNWDLMLEEQSRNNLTLSVYRDNNPIHFFHLDQRNRAWTRYAYMSRTLNA
tara:strand:+ start:3762 stop:4253 length:492 start_codon:yes stop_codon:yes gene_type:complete